MTSGLDSPRDTSTAAPVGSAPPGRHDEGGWAGMLVFAAVIMIMLGIYHAIAGLVALFEDEYYLVGTEGLVVEMDFTGWGWTHLIGGVVIMLAGFGVLSGRMWARVVGIVLAVISAVVNMAFFEAYPWWSAIMIALDVLVIWALAAHGRALVSPARS